MSVFIEIDFVSNDEINETFKDYWTMDLPIKKNIGTQERAYKWNDAKDIFTCNASRGRILYHWRLLLGIKDLSFSVAGHWFFELL